MPDTFPSNRNVQKNSAAKKTPNQAPTRWDVLVIFVGTALVSLTLVPWWGFTVGYSYWTLLLFVLFLFWNGLSITAGYHRLWSHRAYEARPLIRLVFALGGALALQNSIKEWCSGHRHHHRYVDDPDLDPYAATRGLWYSHIGWMLKDYRSGESDYSNIKDLEKDPIVNWQHKYYFYLAFTLNVGVPMAIGSIYGDAIGALLLVGFLRLVICHHTTFFINSLAHFWGNQPYSDENTSKDSPLLALFTYGEGYHNFHHMFQWDYRNGIKWYQYDPTKWLIGALSWTKLAWGLKRTGQDKIEMSLAKMQLKKAAAGIRGFETFERFDKEQWLSKLQLEYDALNHAIHEWAQVQQQWIMLQKNSIREKWENHELKAKLDEIEAKLEEHRRRWQMLTTQFA